MQVVYANTRKKKKEFKNFRKKIYNNVLVIGTGALMSPMTLFQGSSIPAVSHLIRLER